MLNSNELTTNVKSHTEWLKPRKRKDEEGRTEYRFKSSCCSQLVIWYHGERPDECPFCGKLFWNKPGYEYHLFLLQEEYRTTGDGDVLLRLFPVLEHYTRVIIAQILRETNASLRQEEFDTKSKELTYKIFEYVLVKNWIVQSFGSLIKKISPGVLYRKYQEDSHMSLNHIGRNNSAEYWERMAGKIQGLSTTDEIPGDQQVSLVPEITKICEKITEIICRNHGVTESFLFLSGMISKMNRRPLVFLERFYSEFGSQTKKNVELGELEIHDYLVSLQQESA